MKGDALRVSLRPAQAADGPQLLSWRNDPLTLRGSFTGDAVDRDEHAAWLARRLRDPDSRLWIATEGDRPVGQVRLERQPEGQAEISLTVAPEHRKQGYSVEILLAAGWEAVSQGFAVEIVAHVKPDNAASLAMLARAGYQIVSENADEIVLVARPSPR